NGRRCRLLRGPLDKQPDLKAIAVIWWVEEIVARHQRLVRVADDEFGVQRAGALRKEKTAWVARGQVHERIADRDIQLRVRLDAPHQEALYAPGEGLLQQVEPALVSPGESLQEGVQPDPGVTQCHLPLGIEQQPADDVLMLLVANDGANIGCG